MMPQNQALAIHLPYHKSKYMDFTIFVIVLQNYKPYKILVIERPLESNVVVRPLCILLIIKPLLFNKIPVIYFFLFTICLIFKLAD